MAKISKKSLVTFIELPPTQFGRLNSDISPDVYTKSKLPSRSHHVLDGILKKNGWENTGSINPIYHGKNGKLTPENFKRIYDSAILAISSITRTSSQSMGLAHLYKLKNPAGIVIAGGPDPTFRQKEWLKYSDIIVCGEGEKTFDELMNRLIEDPENLEDIKGLALKKNKEIKFTGARERLTPLELSQLPPPFYDEKVISQLRTEIIETSRGCPNNCEFCSVTEFYGKSYRKKSIDSVINQIKLTKDFGMFRFFIDDNLVANPNKTIDLLEAIAEHKLNKKLGTAQVTITSANNPHLIKALKNAGIRSLCIGIESINDETLTQLGKPYNAKQNMDAIKILKEEGFWVHGMMMVGGDGDTLETLKETSQWINKNLDSVQLFYPTPFQGTALLKKNENEGRIITKKPYLYDGQHVVTRPKNFTPYQLQTEIYKMYEDFYSLKNSLKRLKKSPQKKFSLALLTYTKFSKGLQNVLYSPHSRDYLKYLKEIN